jgi:hypothetical protein
MVQIYFESEVEKVRSAYIRAHVDSSLKVEVRVQFGRDNRFVLKEHWVRGANQKQFSFKLDDSEDRLNPFVQVYVDESVAVVFQAEINLSTRDRQSPLVALIKKRSREGIIVIPATDFT